MLTYARMLAYMHRAGEHNKLTEKEGKGARAMTNQKIEAAIVFSSPQIGSLWAVSTSVIVMAIVSKKSFKLVGD